MNARTVSLSSFVTLAASLLIGASDASAKPQKPGTQDGCEGVCVNRVPLTEAQLADIRTRYSIQVQPGHYWYDGVSGAWGYEGQGTAGFLPPGLGLGGKLRGDASSGHTGVFINGRQLPQSDVSGLQAQGIPVVPGRYWVDSQGNGGQEGGPMTFNLVALAQASGKANGNKKGGPWMRGKDSGSERSYVGGDGKGFMYFSNSKGQSVFVGD